MAITVKELKAELAKYPGAWLVGAYEGEGIGLLLKAPDFDYANYDKTLTGWVDTGTPP